jgi:PAS domain S-box-containing protein
VTGAAQRWRRPELVLFGLAAAVLLVLNGLLFIRNREVLAHADNLFTRNPGWVFSALTTPIVVAFLAGGIVLESRRRQEIDRINASLLAMEHVTVALIGHLRLDDLLVDLAGRVREAVGASAAVIHLVTDPTTDDPTLALRAADGPADSVPADLVEEASKRATTITREDQDGRRTTCVAATPLVAEGRMIGVIGVAFDRSAPVTDQELRILRVAGQRAATAVESARLHDAERQARLSAENARSHLALLARASELFDSAIDEYEPALQNLAEVLVPAFADWGMIVATGNGAGIRRLSIRHVDAGVGARFDELTEAHRSWEEPIIAAVGTGQSSFGWGAVTKGPANDFESVLGGIEVESWVLLPVQVRGLSVGAIVLGRTAGRRGFRPSDLEAGRDIASRAAVALERIVLHQETTRSAEATTRQADQLRRLMQAAPQITASLLPRAVLEVFVAQACRVLGARQAVVSLPDIPLRVSSIAEADEDPATEALIEEVERSFRRTGTVGEPRIAAEPGSWLAVPLASSRQSSAGLVVVVGKTLGTFTAEDEAIIVSMAQLAGASLENARLYLDVQANRERLRGVVEATPLAIIELDLDRTVSWWNRAAQDVFGWPAYEDNDLAAVTRNEARPAFPAPLATSIAPMLEAAGRGVATLDVEATWPTETAGSVELSATVVPLHLASGEVTGFLAVVSDITKRKNLEQRLLRSQRMEAIGRLAGGVAHDFNNLLTVILGYSELVLRRMGDDDPKSRTAVDAIRRAGTQGANLTRQLLDMGSHQVADPVLLSVDEVVSSMENVLRRLIAEDVSVFIDLRPAKVLMDPGQLEQVVLNLVVNAGDAMPEGGALVVSTGMEAGSVVITVADTGVGMEPDVLAHCFEPFFTTKERTTGTGLGLATVFGIVEQCEGRIEIDTELGRGTAVRVYLPAADDSLDWEAEDVAPERPPVQAPHDDHVILLVEDDDDLRRLVAEVLTREGYVLVQASNGVDALRAVEAYDGDIDLLVTDVVMPEMDGVELARRLVERWPELPIVYMSGYAGSARDKLRHLRESANFLAKPFEPDDVARRVYDLIHGRVTVRSGTPRLEPS